MAHKGETAVAQSWLPGLLPTMLADVGFENIASATRVLILPQDLAADYFIGAATKAAKAGAIADSELEA